MELNRFFRTIQAKLILIYVLLILLAMQLIGVYFVIALKSSLTHNFTRDLKEKADVLSGFAAPYLLAKSEEMKKRGYESTDNLKAIVKDLFNLTGGEVQILDVNGRIVVTSLEHNQRYVGRKNTETVVIRALQGIRDNEEDFIDDDSARKKVVARPIISNGKITGAVYIVASMKEINQTLERINSIFITGLLISLGFTAALSIILAHTITQPIKQLTYYTKAVADGDFEQRMPVLGDDEIGQLSESFNHMTKKLHEALSINEEEKEKLESILSNMSDGVIAIDENEKVILVNARALHILKTDEAEVHTHPISHFITVDNPSEGEVEPGEKNNFSVLQRIYQPETDKDMFLRITATPVHRRLEGIKGTIYVLQDVTDQEELDQNRRDFVANVSHELRTPLTTIKSYVEALEEGALEDASLAERFISVIHTEAERMIRLVTDLLHLSRFDSKQAVLRRSYHDLREMLEGVVDRFSFYMQERNIQPSVDCDPSLEEVWLDRDQIDRVLDNLVSNAIKYTPDGGTLNVIAKRVDEKTVSFTIKDTGLGIPKKDLSKIFDRFYRVDKARARSMGGTGLGLSIAREIVRAHGGTITLESELHVGTSVTFTIVEHIEERELTGWKK